MHIKKKTKKNSKKKRSRILLNKSKTKVWNHLHYLKKKTSSFMLMEEGTQRLRTEPSSRQQPPAARLPPATKPP